MPGRGAAGTLQDRVVEGSGIGIDRSGFPVTAVCISAPSRDAAGTPVTYGPENMLDGRADTTWRCDGDGVGRQVRIDLAAPTAVFTIGLVPGYAKSDPVDGTDRYAQNRRIAQGCATPSTTAPSSSRPWTPRRRTGACRPSPSAASPPRA